VRLTPLIPPKSGTLNIETGNLMNLIKIFLLALFLVMPLMNATVQSTNVQPARLKILIVHGPNLNLLGRREPNIYGVTTLPQINEQLQKLATELNVELIIVQSNHEGVIIDTFHKYIDDVAGAVINPAGFSFHNVGLHDAIKAMPFPTIETHISNLGTRDAVHQGSIITPAVRGSIMGLGWHSYTAGLRALVEIVREEKAAKEGKK
jgi:3-dehydroquinate dehydratase II